MEGDELLSELRDAARLLRPSEEFLHRGEIGQAGPGRLSAVPCDVGAQHVLGRRWLPAYVRDVVQGRRRLDRDHQVAAGVLQPLAQSEQMGLAQRVTPADGQVAQ